MIIAAHAGTGKTTLARAHPDKIIDLVAMPFKYHLEGSDDAEPEKSKAGYSGSAIQADWPENYADAIKKAANGGKVILIPSDRSVLSLLSQDNLSYILCYPERSAKETYRRRYINRGNTEAFLNIFIDGWDRFIDILENDKQGKRIVMQAHQYLSDVIDVNLLKEFARNLI